MKGAVMEDRRILRWFLIALGLVFLVAVVTAIFLFLATRPSLRLIWQECQPQTVQYDGGEYCVSVLEGALDWRGFPLSVGRTYNIAVTLGTQIDSGHLLDYRFTNELENVEVYIQRSTTEWTPEGVTFVEADGHRLFMPRAVFVGGR
jgi:hypothetical protein